MAADILGMTYDRLESWLVNDLGEKKFRAKQLFTWLHFRRVSSFMSMTDLSTSLRNLLDHNAFITLPSNEQRTSSPDGTVKYAGEFRGYGNLVIVEHSDGTLSLYGFLKDIDVSAGQSIGAGKQVGRSGFIQDRDRAGFRFELRTVQAGRVKLLNPERWLPDGVDYKRRIMEGRLEGRASEVWRR